MLKACLYCQERAAWVVSVSTLQAVQQVGQYNRSGSTGQCQSGGAVSNVWQSPPPYRLGLLFATSEMICTLVPTIALTAQAPTPHT